MLCAAMLVIAVTVASFAQTAGDPATAAPTIWLAS
jgi:hypothetical protein